MNRFAIITILLYLFVFQTGFSQNDSLTIYNKYKPIADKIIQKAFSDSSAFNKLAYFCDVFGPRLSGSSNLVKALDWLKTELQNDGFENVKAEEVMVPHWVRGREYCRLLSPREANISLNSLGGSISTPPEGVTAPVIVVNDVKELDSLADKIKGKILLFNEPFINYGQAVQYRFYGAKWAAKYGAVASLIRSVSPLEHQNLHTGVMGYNDSIPKIPHAAITPEDASMLQRMQNLGITPIINIYSECKTLPDTMSHNIMGDITGSVYPNEIIAIGGHTDSWDLGTGAHDDASGVIAALQAGRILLDLGIKPKRTIRITGWVNEENGSRGGIAYRDKHKNEKHVLMLEQDSGIFPPESIRFTGPDSILKLLKYAEPLFKQIADIKVDIGGGGVDIGPMMKLGVPGISVGNEDNGKYFWYHHSNADTVDKINPHNFNKTIAAIALAIYIYSDFNFELPGNIK
jgi:carboxypeptidase Q